MRTSLVCLRTEKKASVRECARDRGYVGSHAGPGIILLTPWAAWGGGGGGQAIPLGRSLVLFTLHMMNETPKVEECR